MGVQAGAGEASEDLDSVPGFEGKWLGDATHCLGMVCLFFCVHKEANDGYTLRNGRPHPM